MAWLRTARILAGRPSGLQGVLARPVLRQALYGNGNGNGNGNGSGNC
ncbi:hypothetical protein K4L06_07145 [Lysobacter sp. BMK333-48F3]|nr:hypothetical protein [Lysobacter sp. BMK333-48F3]MBX9401085.1 hypothetical protein [Lysobacter sp. BMK333-48F3]